MPLKKMSLFGSADEASKQPFRLTESHAETLYNVIRDGEPYSIEYRFDDSRFARVLTVYPTEDSDAETRVELHEEKGEVLALTSAYLENARNGTLTRFVRELLRMVEGTSVTTFEVWNATPALIGWCTKYGFHTAMGYDAGTPTGVEIYTTPIEDLRRAMAS